MTTKDKILHYIASCYPMDYELAGKAVTTRIVDSILDGKEIEVVTSDKGSNFDVVASIELIAVVVETIKAVLEIIQHFRESQKEEATVEKVKSRVLERLSDSDREKLSGEEFEELLRMIVEDEDD